jgi:hypothetical protein
MRGPQVQLLHAIDLPVIRFTACLRRKGCSARPGKLSPLGGALPRISRRFARAKALSLSRVSQALAQRLKVIEPGIINVRMAAAQDRGAVQMQGTMIGFANMRATFAR